MKLVWSRFAWSDRDDIFSYIEAESPRAAVHVDEQIVDAVRRLLDFPESGRPGRIAGTRELAAHALCRGLLESTTMPFASCACFTARKSGPTNSRRTIEAVSIPAPPGGRAWGLAALRSCGPSWIRSAAVLTTTRVVRNRSSRKPDVCSHALFGCLCSAPHVLPVIGTWRSVSSGSTSPLSTGPWTSVLGARPDRSVTSTCAGAVRHCVP